MTTTKAGRDGERLAADFLRRRGYRILATNYRTRLGEIDLIAEDGCTLVFVEVKFRAHDSFGGAAGAITAAKQAKIARLAAQYLADKKLSDRVCRFDAVLITGAQAPAQSIELVSAAFDAISGAR